MSRNLPKEKIIELIKDFVNDSLKGMYNTPKINKKYKDLSYNGLQVKVSFGLGIPAKVSWIAFLGFDQEVQKGINPVILFNRKDCLILAYGVSEKHKPKTGWGGEIKNNYTKIKDSNCECDLSVIKQKYPNSYLKKCYKLENGKLNKEQLDDLIYNLNDIIDFYYKIFESTYKAKEKAFTLIKQPSKSYHKDKIEGLYFADSKHAEEDVRIITEHLKEKPCTLYFWWHQQPEGTKETINELKERIQEKGYFHIYAIQEGKCIVRYKVKDFFVFKDLFKDKLPESWKDCKMAEIWFDLNERKKAIENWIKNYGKRAGKPKILFKITEVKKLNSGALKKGKRAQIIPFYEGEKVCKEEMNCFEN